ncbi:MAG: hypothetical protein NC131_15680 [Roseburia sp.]|nr:hypothetical protein [Roseburia sp.]
MDMNIDIIEYIISNNILDILKAIVPAIITSITAFLVAKYTYNKSTPLDKLEYAYNEVYYPIYKFIRDKNNYNNVYATRNALKIYFDAYEKYLDMSTIKAFNELYNCKTKTDEKSAYRNFTDNIYSMNTYLRKRLGYLEPNIFQLYKYSPNKDKVVLNGVLVFIGAQIFTIGSTIFTGQLQIYCIYLMILCYGIALLLALIRFVIFLVDKYIK